MIKNLDQILQLAQSTGDRLIVADPEEPEASLAILPLADYQELLSRAGLTKARGFAKVETNVANHEVGDISVKSDFTEQLDTRKSAWSIPASRQARPKVKTEE
jgi:hypothetical protein